MSDDLYGFLDVFLCPKDNMILSKYIIAGWKEYRVRGTGCNASDW